VTGTEGKIEALIDLMRPYGIVEIARTGRVSISRGITRKGGKKNE
jgi:acetolactate synthase-1/3 small subunit